MDCTPVFVRATDSVVADVRIRVAP